jgi:uncharacterized protein YoxC
VRMATKKGVIEKVVESAADAVEELGQAAKGFKESWDHVKKARSKATPATRAAARATKTVTKAAKKGVRKVTGRK